MTSVREVWRVVPVEGFIQPLLVGLEEGYIWDLVLPVPLLVALQRHTGFSWRLLRRVFLFRHDYENVLCA